MSRLSRLAAALPVCALLSGPATAEFFTFELTSTFPGLLVTGQGVAPQLNQATGNDTTFTITGRTTTALSGTPFDDNPITAPVVLSSLNLSVSGPGTLPTVTGLFEAPGLWSWGALNQTASTKPEPVFRFTETMNGIVVRAESALDSVAWELDFDGTTAWFGFGGAVTSDFTAVTSTQSSLFDFDDVVDYSEDFRSPTIRATTSATLVPEINGSGFAYIAFILGALGLWLHSGAGSRRAEAVPA